MDKPMSNVAFRLMSWEFALRDRRLSPKKVLQEVDIKPGAYILDYGCGPGGYTLATAELVGPTGKVYALDIHPLAVQQIKKVAARRGLPNITTILSDGRTGLPDASLDIVLLFDTIHGLSQPDAVLAELHRVLKPNGILSVSDHHLTEESIVSKVTNNGLFQLSLKGKGVYNFVKK
jgi:ubiquinone/menaquinone biosynthesis C-methylase UbiE